MDISKLPVRREEGQASALARAMLKRLMRGESLKYQEAADFFHLLLEPNVTDAQLGAMLIALAVKGETVEELAGMATAMRARAARVKTGHAVFVDTAGTGSSPVKTFNVSTAAAFVAAGAGLPVAKHGNRAVTSRSGSADVLAHLGVRVDVPPEVSESCLNEIGICFMFAPLYHAATARVAALRRELGVQSVFNLLGPLSNPAGAPRQIIGVWHRQLLEPMANTLALLGSERAWIVRGNDGLDEITLADSTVVAEVSRGKVNLFEIGPHDFGRARGSLANLGGGDARKNAEIIRDVLSGERRDGARELVVINAAAALLIGGKAGDLTQAASLAEESIDSGGALLKLDQLVRATNPCVRPDFAGPGETPSAL
jgi:anthranilate phosphoribosyltransferase